MINVKECRNIRAAIMIALLISLIFNIVLSIDSHKYKYKAGREAYNSVLNIRTTNDSNNEILKNVIDNKTISNEELLKLYIIEKDDMTKRNMKRAKKIIKEVYPAKGLIRNIKYLFL